MYGGLRIARYSQKTAKRDAFDLEGGDNERSDQFCTYVQCPPNHTAFSTLLVALGIQHAVVEKVT